MGFAIGKNDNNPYLGQQSDLQSPNGIENKVMAPDFQQNNQQALDILTKPQENPPLPLEGARVNSSIPNNIVNQSKRVWGKQDKSIINHESAEETLRRLTSKDTEHLEFSRSIKKAVLNFIDHLKITITNKGKDILAVFFSRSSQNATKLLDNSLLIKKAARGTNEAPIPLNSPEAKELQEVFGKNSFILNEIDSPLYIEPDDPNDPYDNAARKQALLSNIKGFYSISPPSAKTKEEREEKTLKDLVVINNICQIPKGLELIKQLVSDIKEHKSGYKQILSELKEQFKIPDHLEEVCQNAFSEVGKLNKTSVNNSIKEQANINQLNGFLALNVLEDIMQQGISDQSTWKNIDWSFQAPLIIEDLKKELLDYSEVSKQLVMAVNLNLTDEGDFKKELEKIRIEVENCLKEYKFDDNASITIFARGLINYLAS